MGWLILFLFIMFFLTWKWSYKLMVLLLASLNVDAKYDNSKRRVILREAKYDELWKDVAKELNILQNGSDEEC